MDGVAAHLCEQGAWPKGIPAIATTAPAGQTVRLPGEAATAVLVARLARQMLDLDRQIKPTDKLITSRFRTHPRAGIIVLPGPDRTSARSSWSPPAAPWAGSPPPAVWRPTPGLCPSLRTRAGPPGT
ncbi:hypothetical protein FrEUN1fDRAFT_3371 [Parafrankia sp. EUN1f]|nr:hypothetical protein FrEUN1fDRAFT_3371 [Parafrankia sp. EUN1f]